MGRISTVALTPKEKVPMKSVYNRLWLLSIASGKRRFSNMFFFLSIMQVPQPQTEFFFSSIVSVSLKRSQRTIFQNMCNQNSILRGEIPLKKERTGKRREKVCSFFYFLFPSFVVHRTLLELHSVAAFF